MKTFFKYWRQDLPAGLVVFLVALPLCLGVGLASTKVEGVAGMPNLFSGIIAGIVGGIIVGSLSGSKIGVAGPAAGLLTIVSGAIVGIGSYEGFLLAVVISGIIQLIAGFVGAGIIGNYFPSSVIKGMLAAIGITLILKEIPHAIGYDADFMGDEAFFEEGRNTFSSILRALGALQPGAVIISAVSLLVLVLFDRPFMKKIALFKIVPGALFVVVLGIVLNGFFMGSFSSLALRGDHLVVLPIAESLQQFTSFFTLPDFSFISNPKVWIAAFTIALVGSLETLLSVEATDKIQEDKERTPTNRELKAQGVGNILSGMIGGLPVTQVIVRSSANVNAGGKSQLATVFHGILLLLCVLLIPGLLNLIPLASLAAILLMVGYKLSKISLYKSMYKLGLEQFLPFTTTVVAVLFTDLLRGIGIGMLVAIFYILKKNFKNNFKTETKNSANGEQLYINLSEEVTFLNKAGISSFLDAVPPSTNVVIDGSNCQRIDYDVLEIIQDFVQFSSHERNIKVETINIPSIQILNKH
ncbi:MAG: SulP family inorganic anion transporter [Bacteroidota bacterium]